MRRARRCRRLLAAVLLGLSAPLAAKESPMDFKPVKNELFSCEVPAGWRAKPLMDGKPGYFLTSGLESIRVERVDDAKEAVENAKKLAPEASASTATVLGQKAAVLRTQYRTAAAGDDVRTPAQWTYEETIVVPAKKGSWQIKYSSTSRLRRAKPSGGEALQRFLKTFKPL